MCLILARKGFCCRKRNRWKRSLSLPKRAVTRPWATVGLGRVDHGCEFVLLVVELVDHHRAIAVAHALVHELVYGGAQQPFVVAGQQVDRHSRADSPARTAAPSNHRAGGNGWPPRPARSPGHNSDTGRTPRRIGRDAASDAHPCARHAEQAARESWPWRGPNGNGDVLLHRHRRPHGAVGSGTSGSGCGARLP